MTQSKNGPKNRLDFKEKGEGCGERKRTGEEKVMEIMKHWSKIGNKSFIIREVRIRKFGRKWLRLREASLPLLSVTFNMLQGKCRN